MIRYKLIVKGKVQGVGFRYFTSKEALLFNIKGYVKNLSNGNVEIDAEGTKDSMTAFINQISQGPTYSSVDEVLKEELDFSGYNNFEILHF